MTVPAPRILGGYVEILRYTGMWFLHHHMDPTLPEFRNGYRAQMTQEGLIQACAAQGGLTTLSHESQRLYRLAVRRHNPQGAHHLTALTLRFLLTMTCPTVEDASITSDEFFWGHVVGLQLACLGDPGHVRLVYHWI